MATITPVSVAIGGTAVPPAAASGGGDSIHAATPTTRLIVTNGGGSPITVTMAGVVVCPHVGGTVHNVATTVAAGATEQIPVPPQCIDPATGFVAVTYSAVTSVTVSATA